MSVVFGFLSLAHFSAYINRLTINSFWQNDGESLAWLVRSLIPHFRKSDFGNLRRHSIAFIQTDP